MPSMKYPCRRAPGTHAPRATWISRWGRAITTLRIRPPSTRFLSRAAAPAAWRRPGPNGGTYGDDKVSGMTPHPSTAGRGPGRASSGAAPMKVFSNTTTSAGRSCSSAERVSHWERIDRAKRCDTSNVTLASPVASARPGNAALRSLSSKSDAPCSGTNSAPVVATRSANRLPVIIRTRWPAPLQVSSDREHGCDVSGDGRGTDDDIPHRHRVADLGASERGGFSAGAFRRAVYRCRLRHGQDHRGCGVRKPDVAQWRVRRSRGRGRPPAWPAASGARPGSTACR